MGNVTQVGPSQDTEDIIITRVTVDTQVLLRSDRQQHKLNLYTRGGTVGCYSVFAEDQPKFAVGEQVLLFLARSDSEASRNMTVTDGAQGEYSIVNGTAQATSSADIMQLYALVTKSETMALRFRPIRHRRVLRD